MKHFVKISIVITAFCVVITANGQGDVNKPDAPDVSIADVIASTQKCDLVLFCDVAGKYHESRERLGAGLIGTLMDKDNSNPYYPKLSDSNLKKCSAAYYLGEMRYAAASEALCSKIALQFDRFLIAEPRMVIYRDDWVDAAVEALVRIGSPCLPAVIGNLADTDAEKVKNLLLKVLYRIDGDKDIAQLRLQKALKAEKDSQKQARLQAAQTAVKSFPQNGSPTCIDTATFYTGFRINDQEDGNKPVSNADVIASTQRWELILFCDVCGKYYKSRQRLGTALIDTLTDKDNLVPRDPKLSKSNLKECSAAYYLGEMRYVEASEALCSRVTLHLDPSVFWKNRLVPFRSEWDDAPMEALVKIGSPCFPALINNLANNDDPHARKELIKVLCRIDGDKEIAQLRLQKALKAEQDPQRQVRLQAALKTFF